ncbi:hypothetical protein, partial [Burkholderia sp. Bp9090]|uniref:hypothetical protein n=1 Tax=Burkholderia sp. Bp9090 TaxID=2184567 RepID=UPI0021AB0B24
MTLPWRDVSASVLSLAHVTASPTVRSPDVLVSATFVVPRLRDSVSPSIAASALPLPLLPLIPPPMTRPRLVAEPTPALAASIVHRPALPDAARVSTCTSRDTVTRSPR